MYRKSRLCREPANQKFCILESNSAEIQADNSKTTGEKIDFELYVPKLKSPPQKKERKKKKATSQPHIHLLLNVA